MQLSGLQKDVLSLFRSFLRATKKKQNLLPDEKKSLLNFISKEFRIQAHTIPRTNFNLIEHHIRQGKKKKALLEMPGFRGAFGIVTEHTDQNKTH